MKGKSMGKSSVGIREPIAVGEALVAVGRTCRGARKPLQVWLRQHEGARRLLVADWAALLEDARKNFRLGHGVVASWFHARYDDIDELATDIDVFMDGVDIDDLKTWGDISYWGSGWTLAHLAAEGGHYHALRHMLDSGMPVDALAGNPIGKWTPLTLIAAVPIRTTENGLPNVDRQATADCVRLLLDRGTNINQVSSITHEYRTRLDSPTTALTNAVVRGDVGVTRLLLERGASRAILNHEYWVAWGATASINPEIVDLIRWPN